MTSEVTTSQIAVQSTSSGRVQLVAVVVAVAVAWLVVFPRLSRTTDAEARLERYEKAGIDVSAMFYTDHPRSLPHAAKD